MLHEKWMFLVTLCVLVISNGYADSGEVLGYGMPSPTGCVNDPCHPLLSPPPPSLSGYPSYGTPPPPSPISGYPSYKGPPPPTPLSGYPSYGTSPPPPPSISGYPSYGAPPPPPPTQASPSAPGQGCSPPAPVQCCLHGPPAPYEYLPNQNSYAPSPLPLSWFSVMLLPLSFALLL